jgi:hypothetical protein
MVTIHKYKVLAAIAAMAIVGGASAVKAAAVPFLAVDMNGGPIASANATTEGFNGATVAPDSNGVTWSPWGGPTSTGGDGTQLPSSQSSPAVFASSITKAFGAVTATISEAGTASNYAQGGGGATMNSRDRGNPTGAADDDDMYRDLLFAGGSGSNVQSTNYLQLALSGLSASTTYKVALYSYDSSGGHTANWSATNPATITGDSSAGYVNTTSGTFAAPPDEQSVTWSGAASGSTSLVGPAPAVFTISSTSSGTLAFYGWGGNGVTGTNNADTSYLNGFTVTAVPEPASFSLIGLGAMGLLARRRKA